MKRWYRDYAPREAEIPAAFWGGLSTGPERLAEVVAFVASEFDDGSGNATDARSVYYHLRDAGMIPNPVQMKVIAGGDEGKAKKLTKRLTDAIYDLVLRAREAGQIDWDAIVEEGRDATDFPFNRSVEGFVGLAPEYYTADLQDGQARRVEIFTEKKGTVAKIEHIAAQYQIPIYPGGGSQSGTAMEAAAGRYQDDGGKFLIVYVGDHDVSGIDFDRDLVERLIGYGDARDASGEPLYPKALTAAIYDPDEDQSDIDVLVHRVALTKEQAVEGNLQSEEPNVKDSNFEKYTRIFAPGEEIRIWELAAMGTAAMQDALREALEEHIDPDIFEAARVKEGKDRALLSKLFTNAWNDHVRKKRRK